MEKIINIASFMCVILILIIACTVNEGIYGKWSSFGDTPVFGDNVDIVKLRTKEGANFPYYTLIYDNDFHASACQKSPEDKEICLSMLLKTTHIHPTDEITSVIAAPLKGKDYLLESKIEYKFGYTLLHWTMTFPDRHNQQITQTFRRDWF